MRDKGGAHWILVIRAWMTRGQPGLIARITGPMEVSCEEQTTEGVGQEPR